MSDAVGEVVGLVTAFDIFKALLNTDTDVSTAGKQIRRRVEQPSFKYHKRALQSRRRRTPLYKSGLTKR